MRAALSKLRPSIAAVALTCLVLAGCSDSDDDSAGAAAPSTTADDGGVAGDPTEPSISVGPVGEQAHADSVDVLARLLPADSRGVVAIDVASMLDGDPSAEVVDLLRGDGGDPALRDLLGEFGALTRAIDVPGTLTSALLVHTTDAADGPLLLARHRAATLAELTAGSPAPRPDGVDGQDSTNLYLDADGNELALLPDGVVIVGSAPAVRSVLDVADGAAPASASALEPFLVALDPDADIGFVLGLPALFREVTPDRTLRGAPVTSGALDVADGAIEGTLTFHTANAEEFVATYNTLDRHATGGDDPTAQPLTLAEPVVGDLGRVVVTVPASPIDPAPDDVLSFRNTVKKLVVGMEAYDYAVDVFNPGNAAWFDFLVKSELDDTPPSPGSVYIRWEFRDQAAVEAFEANELPAGFRLAPTRFLESDPPEGGYFLALNLYNGGGGMIVGGARAEWDVFVHGPDGADPNAGVRPRFMVVDVAAEELSANSRDLLTPAEPVSHELVDGVVTSSVRRIGEDTPVFESSFPVPDPSRDEVARFTREMAIGNDYIYWAHGVSDRVLYNATTFNHDAYFVDPSQITVIDNTRWAEYLKPTVSDAVYYVNTLEYVASPMANLVDSEHLDITPEWRDELLGFVNNGHQAGLMRKAVELQFRGQADALVPLRVSNETPSTYFHFEITDPEGLEQAVELPPGHRLAPVTLFEGGEPGYYLTLSIVEIDDAIEGTRAEWSVYTDDGDGRPGTMVLDLMTEDVAIDPVSIVNLPSVVDHDLADGIVSVRLSSPEIAFEASFDTTATTDQELSLDWIEAGDVVCTTIGICDKYYYDAETLDVPVHRPAEVDIEALATPWSDFVSSAPFAVFYRDNAQQYVVKRWQNLRVPVDELPFGGLQDRTHEITGTGNLVGRDSDIADSVYTYTGDAVLDGDQLTFALDQQVENALGVGHIYTTGTFDLTNGTGTQTVVDCLGPALLCSDIENGSTALYAVQDLDASDPEAISWRVDVVLDLGGSFGTADSASTFLATRVD